MTCPKFSQHFGAFARASCPSLGDRDCLGSAKGTATKEGEEPCIFCLWKERKKIFPCEVWPWTGAIIDCASVHQNRKLVWSLSPGLLWAGSRAKEATEKGVVLEPG